MKIQKLTIENIASIEHAVIDFDSAPLSSDPIFLITGDTGTGKTSILNAICLALYNKVPAFETFGANKREKDHEEIGVKDTTQLVRKGTGYAAVELCFIGNDDKPYVARWAVQRARRKPTGKMQAVSRSVYDVEKDDNYTLVDQIETLIQRVVGLTFDQFTRTTMLAQGQFSTFLKAKDDEKSTILEKLTGTEIYSVIGRNISESYRDVAAELNTQEASLEGYKLLSDEQKQAHVDQIKTLEAKRTELDKHIDSIKKRHDWLIESARLDKLIATAQEALDRAQTKAKSDECLQYVDTVERWNATIDARRNLTDELSATANIGDLSTELQLLSGKQWQTILDGVAWIEAHIRQLREMLRPFVDRQQQLSPVAEILNHSQSISDSAAHIKKSVKDAAEHRALSQSKAKKADDSRAAEIPLEQALIAAEAKRDAIDAELKAKDTEIAAIDTDAVTARQSELSVMRDTLIEAKSAVKAYRDSHERQASAVDTLQNAQSALALTDDELKTQREGLPDAKAEWDKAQGVLTGMMKIKDHINDLRSTFAETGKCPLCGNPDAHMRSDEVIDADLKAAQEAELKARMHHRELSDAVNRLEAQKKVQQAAVATAQSALGKAIQDLAAAEESARAKAPDYSDPDCMEGIDRQIQTIDQERQTLNERLDLAKTLQKERKAIEKRLASQRDDVCQKAKDELTRQRLATVVMTKNAESEASLAAKCDDDAAAELVNLRTMLFGVDREGGASSPRISALIGCDDITTENAEAVAETIKRHSDDYNEICGLINLTQTEIDNNLRTLDRCQKSMSKLAERFGTDRTVNPVECRGLEDDIQNLNADVSRIDGKIQGETLRRDEAARALEGWLGQAPYTRDDLLNIGKISDQEVREMQRQINEIKKAESDAESALSAYVVQMEDLNKRRPDIQEGDTVDTLRIANDAAASERNTVISDKGALERILAEDKIKAEEMAGKLECIEQLRKAKMEWAELNTIFGNADGSLFKKIAQSYILRILLLRTNEYLRMLTHRYRLDCEDGSLTINVIDAYQADTVRNVGLLSGGEGFIVSLALALGLSSISQAKINVDTLFIDEGFGSLDKDTLDTVITVLDRLHSVGGRRIGIISHVQDLKERIPTQIRLERTGPSSSRVVVTTL